ncbi:hypothetical protein ACVPOS_10735 [Staphylococcus aureus]
MNLKLIKKILNLSVEETTDTLSQKRLEQASFDLFENNKKARLNYKLKI